MLYLLNSDYEGDRWKILFKIMKEMGLLYNAIGEISES